MSIELIDIVLFASLLITAIAMVLLYRSTPPGAGISAEDLTNAINRAFEEAARMAGKTPNMTDDEIVRLAGYLKQPIIDLILASKQDDPTPEDEPAPEAVG